jgi:hypothetical protein
VHLSSSGAYSQNPKLQVALPDEHSLESLHALQSGRVVPGSAASNAQSHETGGV